MKKSIEYMEFVLYIIICTIMYACIKDIVFYMADLTILENMKDDIYRVTFGNFQQTEKFDVLYQIYRIVDDILTFVSSIVSVMVSLPLSRIIFIRIVNRLIQY